MIPSHPSRQPILDLFLKALYFLLNLGLRQQIVYALYLASAVQAEAQQTAFPGQFSISPWFDGKHQGHTYALTGLSAGASPTVLSGIKLGPGNGRKQIALTDHAAGHIYFATSGHMLLASSLDHNLRLNLGTTSLGYSLRHISGLKTLSAATGLLNDDEYSDLAISNGTATTLVYGGAFLLPYVGNPPTPGLDIGQPSLNPLASPFNNELNIKLIDLISEGYATTIRPDIKLSSDCSKTQTRILTTKIGDLDADGKADLILWLFDGQCDHLSTTSSHHAIYVIWGNTVWQDKKYLPLSELDAADYSVIDYPDTPALRTSGLKNAMTIMAGHLVIGLPASRAGQGSIVIMKQTAALRTHAHIDLSALPETLGSILNFTGNKTTTGLGHQISSIGDFDNQNGADFITTSEDGRLFLGLNQEKLIEVVMPDAYRCTLSNTTRPFTLSNGGRLNDDAYNDVMVGMPYPCRQGKEVALGRVYGLYGRSFNPNSLFYTPKLDGKDGFVVEGAKTPHSSDSCIGSALHLASVDDSNKDQAVVCTTDCSETSLVGHSTDHPEVLGEQCLILQEMPWQDSNHLAFIIGGSVVGALCLLGYCRSEKSGSSCCCR